MNGLPYTEAEIIARCRAHLANIKCLFTTPNANFVVLPSKGAGATYAVKLAGGLEKTALQYEHAFMDSLSSSNSSSYRVPKTYCLFEDKKFAYLVMEYLEGPTMWEIMGEGTTPLSPKDANDIAVALRELRNDQKLVQYLQKAGFLTPLGHWDPQAHIFPPDGDGGRLLVNQRDFLSFMTIRFKEAQIDPSAVPLNEWGLAHGDPSPENFKRCPDGRIGILDFRTMFLAPTWWDFYSLHRSGQPISWVKPLKEAMHCQQIDAPAALVDLLDEKWIPWFAIWGAGWARMERKQGKGILANSV